jgi:hypothetical protein
LWELQAQASARAMSYATLALAGSWTVVHSHCDSGGQSSVSPSTSAKFEVEICYPTGLLGRLRRGCNGVPAESMKHAPPCVVLSAGCHNLSEYHRRRNVFHRSSRLSNHWTADSTCLCMSLLLLAPSACVASASAAALLLAQAARRPIC